MSGGGVCTTGVEHQHAAHAGRRRGERFCHRLLLRQGHVYSRMCQIAAGSALPGRWPSRLVRHVFRSRQELAGRLRPIPREC